MYDSSIKLIVDSNCPKAIQLIERMKREWDMARNTKIQTAEGLQKRIEQCSSIAKDKESGAVAALDYIEAFYRTKYNNALGSKPFNERDVDTLQRQLQEAFSEVEAFIFIRLATILCEAEQYLEAYDDLQCLALNLTEKIIQYAEKRPEHLKLSKHAEIEARLRKAIDEVMEVSLPIKKTSS